jgi:hypothetical protein
LLLKSFYHYRDKNYDLAIKEANLVLSINDAPIFIKKQAEAMIGNIARIITP